MQQDANLVGTRELFANKSTIINFAFAYVT